jgi:transglutaminase-like putative cysteine protease
MRRLGSLVATVSLLAFGGLAAAADGVGPAPLHVIPTEDRSEWPIPPDARMGVRLSGPDPQALAKAFRVTLAANQTSFDYIIDEYPQLRGDETRTWLESTFVIDYTEPVFEPLRAELLARTTKTSRQQLVEYVAALVETSDERDWDLASVVARRRKGDCSEHAVLTAALARMQGIPARVMIGVVLVSDDRNHGAFGHAWAEVLEDGKWKVADAALFDWKNAARYLPIGLMEDEGMGFSMDLVRILQIWIDRVVVLGPR